MQRRKCAAAAALPVAQPAEKADADLRACEVENRLGRFFEGREMVGAVVEEIARLLVRQQHPAARRQRMVISLSETPLDGNLDGVPYASTS
jgi:hypothetical protein